MKTIYISTAFFLEVRDKKEEFRPVEIIKIINLKHDENVSGIDLLASICSPKSRLKLILWRFFHTQIAIRFNDSIFGKMRVWFLAFFFNRDTTETFINHDTFRKEAQSLTDFLTEPNDTHLRPLSKLGLFQSLHDKAFKNMTALQFIEANRCWMMIQKLRNEQAKAEAINELISYLFLPKIAWTIPFWGTTLRAYFLKDEFLEKRKALASKLDATTKVLLIEYYAQNVALVQKTYKEFYSGGKSEGNLDIVTQYFSMKNLIQMRSPNMIPHQSVSMMQIIDLLDSYETEMRVAAEKLKSIKQK